MNKIENKKNVIIGFDIGIASVGWCVTDYDSLEIIKHGVRTFDTVDDPMDFMLLNEERREKRTSRRQINRRKVLKRDFIKWLIESNFVTDIKLDKENKFVNKFREKYINDSTWRKEQDKNSTELGGIFNLRLKGLNKELNKQELISVLYWYINHRGFKYEIINTKIKDKDKDKESKLNYKKYIDDLKNKCPVEIQIDYFNDNKFLNGHLNSIFHFKNYKKEINKIFSNITYLTSEFKNKFFEFFERQRSYEIGPGSEKSPSEYGLWIKNKDGKIEKKHYFKTDENGKKIKVYYESIWESNIGKCTIYKDEFRAPKESLSALLFNLLQDLNNLNISSKNIKNIKLNKEQKLEIIKLKLNKKTITQIKKYIKNQFEDEVFISGFRKDSKDKDLLTKFTSYNSILKVFKKYKYEYGFENIFNFDKYIKDNLINKLCDILSKTEIKEERKNNIEKIKFTDFSQDLINDLSEINNITSGRHNFSYKALNEFIEKMIVESKNHMEILYSNDSNYNLISKYNLKKNDFLTNNVIDELILTPTVKRSLRQTIKVFNEINKFCKNNDLEIKNIIIEMARETNNKDRKEIIKNIQNNNENIKKIIKEYTEKYNQDYDKVPNELKNKIWFWLEQKQCDVYTGKKIELEDILQNHQTFEIDHIIPYSQSFDNSKNNKVLTNKLENKQKGNRTVYQYFKHLGKLDKFKELSKKWEDWYLNNTKNKNKKKFDFLTTKIDFSNPENQIGFIQRNLVDTRYATKEFLNLLIEYKKINNFSFNVKTTNGKMTYFCRNIINKEYWKNKDKKYFLINPILKDIEDIKKKKELKKDRIWHGHHAQDAYFITVLSKWYKDHKIIEKYFDKFFYTKYNLLEDKNTNSFKEIVKTKEINSIYQKLIKNILNACLILNKNVENIYFSRKIEKKNNKKLFNETLYKAIDKGNNKIQKIVYKKLIDLKEKDCKKYFDKNSKDLDKIVIKDKNPKMYYELCNIFENYKENKDSNLPFQKAMIENKKKSIICNINNREIEVKKIQILSNVKNKDDVVFLKENKLSFYDSFNWFKIYVYKNKNNQKKLIPINCLNSKIEVLKIYKNGKLKQINKLKIDEKKLKLQKEKYKIDEKSIPIDVWYNGTILVDLKDNKKYYVAGITTGDNGMKVEVKPIDYNFSQFNKISKKTSLKQLKKSINTWKFKKIYLNILD